MAANTANAGGSSANAADTNRLIKSISTDSAQLASQSQSSDLRSYLESIQNISNAYVGRAENGTGPDNKPRDGSDYLKVLRSTLDDKVGAYKQNSQRLVDYSDMHATNEYVHKELKREMEETKTFINKLRNKIFTGKQNSQESIYQLNRYRSLLFTVLFTTLALLLVMLIIRLNILGFFGTATMAALLFVLGVVYILTMVLSSIRNSFRTRLDWSKFYWDFKDEKKGCPTVTATKKP